MEAGIVTITLTEYESYKELQKGLKKRKVISSHNYNGKTFYMTEDGSNLDILEKIIKDLRKEIDDFKLADYNRTKENINKRLGINKKWYHF